MNTSDSPRAKFSSSGGVPVAAIVLLRLPRTVLALLALRPVGRHSWKTFAT